MSRTSQFGHRHPGSEWRVSHRAARTDWADTVERCAACRASVDMREDHYQMVLDRDVETPGKLSIERQRLVFCDETCADDWAGRA